MMVMEKKIRPKRTARSTLRILLSIGFLSLLFLVLLFLDTYSWRSLRTVGIRNDPRWRVFDFHSRQASESEIYSVAEIPAIKSVRKKGRRRLRFVFHPPFHRTPWRVVDAQNMELISQGPAAEIPFPDFPHRKRYRFIPEEIPSHKEVYLEIDFFPRERYAEKGLSWPDNYWLVESTVPFTLKKPFSAAEWAGLAPDDPEVEEARRILGERSSSSSTLDRAEQVFLFTMEALRRSRGTPDDKLQAASPLETYVHLTGGSKGFCENRALVYYIFANAAGIKTRLIHAAGKFGPLKLTGHYFCESYIPEAGTWMYVDPQSGVARARHREGKLLHTIDLKKLFDLGSEEEVIYSLYDEQTGTLADRTAREPNIYLVGDVVIAYPFGYGRAKSFSKIRNFLRYPTLLYATFPVPPLLWVKVGAMAVFLASASLSFVLTVLSFVQKKFWLEKKKSRGGHS